ncbi:histidine kinase dimerization/phosphoacceptor domain-containing protein [Streptomyces sp. MB09-01]|uniref:histidine kinase dimerization/phosphoacceptor domain-containing protein n=1 Tax=Streptomyces sp. MB09-01 TaxID=3028666 RepID=UPI002B273AAC|nr:histidine kinase dimerization/phosphoacceptor domain-containing protein [Streptomyces sp. MB09-01]
MPDGAPIRLGPLPLAQHGEPPGSRGALRRLRNQIHRLYVPDGRVLAPPGLVQTRTPGARRGVVCQAPAQAVTGERLRTARELHDAIAHGVGAIAVQAGVGRRVIGTRQDESGAYAAAASHTDCAPAACPPPPRHLWRRIARCRAPSSSVPTRAPHCAAGVRAVVGGGVERPFGWLRPFSDRKCRGNGVAPCCAVATARRRPYVGPPAVRGRPAQQSRRTGVAAPEGPAKPENDRPTAGFRSLVDCGPVGRFRGACRRGPLQTEP